MNQLTKLQRLQETLRTENARNHYLQSRDKSDCVDELCAEIDTLEAALATATRESERMAHDFQLQAEHDGQRCRELEGKLTAALSLVEQMKGENGFAHDQYSSLNAAYQQLAQDYSAAIEQAGKMKAALNQILTDVPASDGNGGLYHMHHDENGEELGPESIDPMAVIQHLQGIVHRALTLPADQPKQEEGE